jgi:hypothetical protein
MDMTNEIRQRADAYLLRAVIADGCTVSIIADGEVLLRRSALPGHALRVLGGVEEAKIVVRNANGEKVGAAYVVYDYGQERGSELADWSAGYVDDVMTAFLANA